MASLNKVQLIGYLGQDPDLRFTRAGTAVCNMSIATKDIYKDKTGATKESTEWHRVVLYGRVAEVAGDRLKQGSLIYIEGRNKTERWTDKSNQERYTTKVEGTLMKMLDRNQESTQHVADQPHDDVPY